MNLIQLRTEALAHGFDSAQYGSRIDQYINDCLMKIATEVNYYQDEATQTFATVAGTDVYAWPAGLAEIRSLFDTDRQVEIEYASVREMDRSVKVNGTPLWYSLTGQNIRLYPIPDMVYNLELRYWQLPATLVNDTDIPALPIQWHRILWMYAVWQCFEGDDDAQLGAYWAGRFNAEFSDFKADVKFPDADGPAVASSMWDSEPSLGVRRGWSPGWL